MTVPVCDTCIEKIKQGETVQFVYKNQEYKASLNALEKVEASKEEEDPIYPDFESAWPALERGERVRIEMEPFQIDPWLVQKALDLQSQERLEEWRQKQQQQKGKSGE